MEVGKFYKVVKHLSEKINSTTLQSNFSIITQNIQKLGTNSQVHTPQNAQSIAAIEKARNEIINIIHSFIPNNLSVEESKIYEALGAFELFGPEGQQTFSQIFLNLATNHTDVKERVKKYQNMVFSIPQLYSYLSPLQNKLNFEEKTDDSDLIIIYFQSKAEINFLNELSLESKKWNNLLRAFALLTRENNTNFKVEKIERGSLILTLIAVSAAVVFTLAKAVKEVQEVIIKHYQIKKLAFDAKQLKIAEGTIKELEESSKLKLKTESSQITQLLVKEAGWTDDQNRKDIDTALNMAIQNLFEFLNKGGKVDVKLIAQNEANRQIEMNLSINYSDIKALEKSITPDEGLKPPLLDIIEKDEEE